MISKWVGPITSRGLPWVERQQCNRPFTLIEGPSCVAHLSLMAGVLACTACTPHPPPLPFGPEDNTVEPLFIVDTIGTKNSVHYSKVSLTQGLLVYFQ